jgi:hypothetical protein
VKHSLKWCSILTAHPSPNSMLCTSRLDPNILSGTIHCVKYYNGTEGENLNGSKLCVIVPKESGRRLVALAGAGHFWCMGYTNPFL